MPFYTVKQGECISSIADKTGFYWATLWNHTKNQDLRMQRENPNALLPGDQVFVPEKRQKEEQCNPTMRHVFRIRSIPVRFNLQLIDTEDKPRVGVAYTIVIDGKRYQGVTPDDGRISLIIAANASKATLTLEPDDGSREDYTFQLGYMNPIDDPGGIQGRLLNLGYYKGQITGTIGDDTADAIRRFQQDRGLRVTGEIDDPTKSALAQRHGG